MKEEKKISVWDTRCDVEDDVVVRNWNRIFKREKKNSRDMKRKEKNDEERGM